MRFQHGLGGAAAAAAAAAAACCRAYTVGGRREGRSAFPAEPWLPPLPLPPCTKRLREVARTQLHNAIHESTHGTSLYDGANDKREGGALTPASCKAGLVAMGDQH